MDINDLNINQTQPRNKGKSIGETAFPTTYHEKKIGRTLYCVTSVFLGQKELGATLEKLAVQRVLSEMDSKAKELLRA